MGLLYSALDSPMFRHRPKFSGRRLGVAPLLSRLFLPTVFVVLTIMPVTFLDRMPRMCVYQAVFGVRCPGCGMTHAFCAVLHGHLVAAFDFNHLVIVAFPFFALMAIRNLTAFIHDGFSRR